MSYFEISGQNEIGQFKISRTELWNSQKEQIKISGFKADVFERIDNSVQGGASINVYNPGCVTRAHKFYKVPFSIGYLEVEKITTIRTWNSTEADKVIVDIVISSKDSQYFKSESVVIANAYELYYAVDAINYLNWLIKKDGNIDSIDLTKFTREVLKKPERYQVFKAIDNLTFECFANSQNRVGKENLFWLETVVENLPEDLYLRNLFEQGLRANCSYLSSGNGSFTITEEHEREYAPAYPRRKLEGTGHEQNYREILRYETAARLSFNEMVNARLSKGM